MTRPHLSKSPYDPEDEMDRLLSLLAENSEAQKARGYTDIVLIAEQGTLLRWMSYLWGVAKEDQEPFLTS